MFVEIFGTFAIAVMVLTYAFEDRSDLFVLGFAVACAAAALYAVLIDSWPFAVAEAIWAGVAVRRWRQARQSS